jgi:hypothetical protein
VLELKKKKSGRPHAPNLGGGGAGMHAPFAVGQRVRDRQFQREGTIVDVACQYAHPKADPVYNYLIRWEDGQVQAFGAQAFDGGYGLEPVD